MAATTTAFETEILGFPASERGLMGGPSFRLRDAYLRGVADPLAHTLAKTNPDGVGALNANGKMASFDAITAP